jgi:hypothetical protein
MHLSGVMAQIPTVFDTSELLGKLRCAGLIPVSSHRRVAGDTSPVVVHSLNDAMIASVSRTRPTVSQGWACITKPITIPTHKQRPPVTISAIMSRTSPKIASGSKCLLPSSSPQFGSPVGSGVCSTRIASTILRHNRKPSRSFSSSISRSRPNATLSASAPCCFISRFAARHMSRSGSSLIGFVP